MQLVDPARFAAVAWELVGQPDVDQTVGQVIRAARDVTAAHEVGVMREVGSGTVQIAGTSTASVRRADELQLELGEGPCLSASRTQELVLITDTRCDPRWPSWGPAAAALGWNSILSLPLVAGNRGLGALNLYATERGSFGDFDVEVGQIFARHAAIALAHRMEEEHLRETMRREHVIGQAQGVLMERFDLSVTRAMVALQRHATLRQTDIFAVAQHVIGVRRLPDLPLVEDPVGSRRR